MQHNSSTILGLIIMMVMMALSATALPTSERRYVMMPANINGMGKPRISIVDAIEKSIDSVTKKVGL